MYLSIHLAPLCGEIDIWARRLFCTKFNYEQLLFEAFWCDVYFWQRLSINAKIYAFSIDHNVNSSAALFLALCMQVNNWTKGVRYLVLLGVCSTTTSVENRVFRRSNPNCSPTRWIAHPYEPPTQKPKNLFLGACEQQRIRQYFNFVVLHFLLYLSVLRFHIEQANCHPQSVLRLC